MTTETTPAKVAKTAVSNLTLGSADDALTLARELQKFVADNKLTSNIQGKQFPNVEAWQFAGTLLGLSPMLESIEDRSTDNEIKWQAMVTVINTRTGATVGRGFATCSNKESTKSKFADYAICSMAQTRAVGKAYRLSLGWLMKAAGYEATPAEEVDHLTGAADVTPPKAAPAPVASPVASAEQRAALVALVGHALVTDEECNKVLAAIDTMNTTKAALTIDKITATIAARGYPAAVEFDTHAAAIEFDTKNPFGTPNPYRAAHE